MEGDTDTNECTFSVFSENSPGVLHRIIVLFTKRKMNIESLTVSHIEVEGMSRFTIVVRTTRAIAETIGKQLRRIIEVHQVDVSGNDNLLYKEIAFFRLSAPDARTRQRIANHALRHGASIVSIDPESLVIEKTGTEEEIQKLFSSFKKGLVVEFIRSGRIALKRHGAEPAESAKGVGEAAPALREILPHEESR